MVLAHNNSERHTSRYAKAAGLISNDGLIVRMRAGARRALLLARTAADEALAGPGPSSQASLLARAAAVGNARPGREQECYRLLLKLANQASATLHLQLRHLSNVTSTTHHKMGGAPQRLNPLQCGDLGYIVQEAAAGLPQAIHALHSLRAAHPGWQLVSPAATYLRSLQHLVSQGRAAPHDLKTVAGCITGALDLVRQHFHQASHRAAADILQAIGYFTQHATLGFSDPLLQGSEVLCLAGRVSRERGAADEVSPQALVNQMVNLSHALGGIEVLGGSEAGQQAWRDVAAEAEVQLDLYAEQLRQALTAHLQQRQLSASLNQRPQRQVLQAGEVQPLLVGSLDKAKGAVAGIASRASQTSSLCQPGLTQAIASAAEAIAEAEQALGQVPTLEQLAARGSAAGVSLGDPELMSRSNGTGSTASFAPMVAVSLSRLQHSRLHTFHALVPTALVDLPHMTADHASMLAEGMTRALRLCDEGSALALVDASAASKDDHAQQAVSLLLSCITSGIAPHMPDLPSRALASMAISAAHAERRECSSFGSTFLANAFQELGARAQRGRLSGSDMVLAATAVARARLKQSRPPATSSMPAGSSAQEDRDSLMDAAATLLAGISRSVLRYRSAHAMAASDTAQLLVEMIRAGCHSSEGLQVLVQSVTAHVSEVPPHLLVRAARAVASATHPMRDTLFQAISHRVLVDEPRWAQVQRQQQGTAHRSPAAPSAGTVSQGGDTQDATPVNAQLLGTFQHAATATPVALPQAHTEVTSTKQVSQLASIFARAGFSNDRFYQYTQALLTKAAIKGYPQATAKPRFNREGRLVHEHTQAGTQDSGAVLHWETEVSGSEILSSSRKRRNPLTTYERPGSLDTCDQLVALTSVAQATSTKCSRVAEQRHEEELTGDVGKKGNRWRQRQREAAAKLQGEPGARAEHTEYILDIPSFKLGISRTLAGRNTAGGGGDGLLGALSARLPAQQVPGGSSRYSSGYSGGYRPDPGRAWFMPSAVVQAVGQLALQEAQQLIQSIAEAEAQASAVPPSAAALQPTSSGRRSTGAVTGEPAIGRPCGSGLRHQVPHQQQHCQGAGTPTCDHPTLVSHVGAAVAGLAELKQWGQLGTNSLAATAPLCSAAATLLAHAGSPKASSAVAAGKQPLSAAVSNALNAGTTTGPHRLASPHHLYSLDVSAVVDALWGASMLQQQAVGKRAYDAVSEWLLLLQAKAAQSTQPTQPAQPPVTLQPLAAFVTDATSQSQSNTGLTSQDTAPQPLGSATASSLPPQSAPSSSTSSTSAASSSVPGPHNRLQRRLPVLRQLWPQLTSIGPSSDSFAGAAIGAAKDTTHAAPEALPSATAAPATPPGPQLSPASASAAMQGMGRRRMPRIRELRSHHLLRLAEAYALGSCQAGWRRAEVVELLAEQVMSTLYSFTGPEAVRTFSALAVLLDGSPTAGHLQHHMLAHLATCFDLREEHLIQLHAALVQATQNQPSMQQEQQHVLQSQADQKQEGFAEMLGALPASTGLRVPVQQQPAAEPLSEQTHPSPQPQVTHPHPLHNPQEPLLPLHVQLPGLRTAFDTEQQPTRQRPPHHQQQHKEAWLGHPSQSKAQDPQPGPAALSGHLSAPGDAHRRAEADAAMAAFLQDLLANADAAAKGVQPARGSSNAASQPAVGAQVVQQAAAFLWAVKEAERGEGTRYSSNAGAGDSHALSQQTPGQQPAASTSKSLSALDFIALQAAVQGAVQVLQLPLAF